MKYIKEFFKGYFMVLGIAIIGYTIISIVFLVFTFGFYFNIGVAKFMEGNYIIAAQALNGYCIMGGIVKIIFNYTEK